MGDPALTRWQKVLRWWYRYEDQVLRPFAIIGLLIVLLFMLWGCGGHEFTKPPHLEQVMVTVRWFDTEAEVREACKNPTWGACATVGRTEFPYPRGWLLRPRSFDDMDRVCRVGHEALHWFGAEHK